MLRVFGSGKAGLRRWKARHLKDWSCRCEKGAGFLPRGLPGLTAQDGLGLAHDQTSLVEPGTVWSARGECFAAGRSYADVHSQPPPTVWPEVTFAIFANIAMV